MYIHKENSVDYENLRYEVSEAIATITIDRPRIVKKYSLSLIWPRSRSKFCLWLWVFSGTPWPDTPWVREMKKSQLVKYLQNRLSDLLQVPGLADARQVRAAQRKGIMEDALVGYNFAVSAELLRLHAASVHGVIKAKLLIAFRKYLTSYMEKNGTGYQGYDTYVAIICEYLAMVAQKPLHPLAVRHRVNNPPQDTDNRRYCALKPRHLQDPFSLCRFCHCLAWPETRIKPMGEARRAPWVEGD